MNCHRIPDAKGVERNVGGVAHHCRPVKGSGMVMLGWFLVEMEPVTIIALGREMEIL